MLTFGKMFLASALLVLGIGLGFSPSAAAIEADAAVDQSIRFGVNSIAVQGPALDRITRTGYAVEYLFPITDGLRIGGLIQLAPDTEAKSKRLDVAENTTSFGPSLELSYPFLFRYALQVVPTYIISNTEITLDSQSESLSHSQFGLMAVGRIQYVIHPIVEAGLFAGVLSRFSDEKTDWLYGLEIAVNITAFGSSGGDGSGSNSGSSSPRKRRG
jgi:hypothetical protein